MTLDEIAIKYNTDKSSKLHNYTARYDVYFSGMRHEKLKILEIGIQSGFSLKTWKEYFQNSKIFGIDIADCSHIDEDRIKTLQGSQNDLSFLKKVNDLYGPFDIIIDDGSHISSDMRISFDFLFPLLKKEGLYVVEDLHCCYWPEFRKNSYSFMDRLNELLDCVNSMGKCGLADPSNIKEDLFYQSKKLGEMNWWEKSIEYIHLFRSIVFIKKSVLGDIDQSYRSIKPPGWLKNKIRFKNLKRTVWKGLRSCLKKMSEIKKPTAPREEILAYRKKIKVYDVFIFFNELELLELRLNMLNNYVDYFIIVEATVTFSGLPKKLFFEENKYRFRQFEHKIIHYIIKDTPTNEDDLRKRLLDDKLNFLDREIINTTLTSDNIPQGQSHWLREFYQKESMKKALVGLGGNDICFISDVDEIWNPEVSIDYTKDDIFKLRQNMYAYFMNNRSSEQWAGTYATKYKNIKHNSINHLDTPSKTHYTYVKNGGWHFTNLGGADRIKQKIESYGHQEFNNDEIKTQIEKRIINNEDFIGRKFKFWVDESNLPKYLLDNNARYKTFFK